MRPASRRRRPLPRVLCAAGSLTLLWAAPVLATHAPGECAPPRTRIVLCPLTDETDHSWATWTGTQPTAIVCRLLADSLVGAHGREVVLAPGSARAVSRPLEDSRALALGREARGEVVVSGVVNAFTQDDRREPGKLSRWGVGPPDARSTAEVRVTLRVLDARDGSVILETTVARERRKRSTASVGRPRTLAEGAPVEPSGPLAEALNEVISDLTRALDQRLMTRWRANVLGTASDLCVIDAGAASGLFAGERLEVWRGDIETYNEDFTRLGEEVRVGTVVITELDGRDRARARLLEGDVRPGDLIRPCTAASPAPLTLRR